MHMHYLHASRVSDSFLRRAFYLCLVDTRVPIYYDMYQLVENMKRCCVVFYRTLRESKSDLWAKDQQRPNLDSLKKWRAYSTCT